MKNKPYPLYILPQITNLKDMLNQRLEAAPDSNAFSYSQGKEVITKTTAEFAKDANALGAFLLHNGHKGHHIAIIGENSYEWLVSFMSIVNGGNVAVTIDKEYSAAEIAELLQKSDCNAVIVSKGYSDLVENVGLHIYNMGEFNTFLYEGQKLIDNGIREFIDYKINPEQLAAIFFTSGTTGSSKGVMLSHKNMASDINYACKNFVLEGDTLAVLPFHHTFGLITAIFKVFHYGKSTHINKSLKRIKQDIATAKPQTIFMVPLFVETFYKQIIDTAKNSGQLSKLERGVKTSDLLLKLGIDVRRKMFGTVLDAFGGNIEYIICGGAPLDVKYVKAYRSWGVSILNGYGITECSPVVSVNRNHYWRDGSVGQILNGCNVQIAEDGEVIVKGDNVMLGYYNDEISTSDVLKDGWYHTGDLGKIDDDGFLFLTGRKKNLIILSNGENVSPEEIESRIQRDDAVCEVVVYEDNGQIVAEIFPVDEYISNTAYFDNLIKQINVGQPKFKQVNSVRLRDKEFEKNTTKKIIRYKVKEEHNND